MYVSIVFCVFAVSLFLVVGRLGVWVLCLCSAWRIGLSDLCLYYDVCVCVFFFTVFVRGVGLFRALVSLVLLWGYFSRVCSF